MLPFVILRKESSKMAREKFLPTLRNLWRSARTGGAGIYSGAGSVTITKERAGNMSFFIESRSSGWEVCYAKIKNGVVEKLLPDELSDEEWVYFEEMVTPYCEAYQKVFKSAV